jgi:hypothetical protein
MSTIISKLVNNKITDINVSTLYVTLINQIFFVIISIISLIVEDWVHTTSLTLPLFIEVPVPSQETERSCICFRGV